VGGGSPSDSLLGTASDRIYSAPVAPDGSVGPWVEDAVRLPEAVSELQLLANDGRLWAVGGQAGPPGFETRAGVASTAILPDGTLDPNWVTADSLPEARHSFGAAFDLDGRLYVVGGVDTSGSSSRSVCWTNVLPDGETTGWNICEDSVPPLPGLDAAYGLSHMPCMYYAHRIFVAGGYGCADAADHGCRTEVLVADLIPGGPTGVPADDGEESPASLSRFAICAVRPNPLSSTARITYTVPTPGCAVSLRIYDVRGRRVRTLVGTERQNGIRDVVWDGRTDDGTPAASGVYFCRLSSGGLSDTRKLVLLR
jgi:FlgD Ig-like domain